MKVIIFEEEAYYKMKAELLEEIIQRMEQTINKLKENDIYLTTSEAKKLLGIKSKSKLQQLRDDCEIAFSQHGRIIMYCKKSLIDFLNRHVVK
ncbi:MAG: helix-turn-helix domain-containing protein [Flavobacteriales bacterium]|nr:helix-turn-helix domain-containing protein [Flavobacteriales bacterium]